MIKPFVSSFDFNEEEERSQEKSKWEKIKEDLSFETDTHDIFWPEFSSEEEEDTPVIRANDEEDYWKLEQYFIESSDSDQDKVEEIDMNYIT